MLRYYTTPCINLMLIHSVTVTVYTTVLVHHINNRYTNRHTYKGGNCLVSVPGGHCNRGHPSKIHLRLKSCETSLIDNLHINRQIIWNFAQSMVVILSCFVQNIKTIWELRNNSFFRNLSLIWVLEGYILLQLTWNCTIISTIQKDWSFHSLVSTP